MSRYKRPPFKESRHYPAVLHSPDNANRSLPPDIAEEMVLYFYGPRVRLALRLVLGN